MDENENIKKKGLSVDRTRDLKICNLTLYH
jgi:hypothetical protein